MKVLYYILRSEQGNVKSANERDGQMWIEQGETVEVYYTIGESPFVHKMTRNKTEREKLFNQMKQAERDRAFFEQFGK